MMGVAVIGVCYGTANLNTNRSGEMREVVVELQEHLAVDLASDRALHVDRLDRRLKLELPHPPPALRLPQQSFGLLNHRVVPEGVVLLGQRHEAALGIESRETLRLEVKD